MVANWCQIGCKWPNNSYGKEEICKKESSMQVLPFALAAYFSDWDWPSCMQIRCNRNEMSGQRLHIQGTNKSPAKLLLGKRCKYSPRKISPEKLTPCYEVPPARCTPCRGRLRSYAKPKNASQLGSQTIFVPEFNRQRIRQSGWNSRSLDKNHYWLLRRFPLFQILKSLDIGIGWKWLNSHVGRMI